jgi:hypothetical protein
MKVCSKCNIEKPFDEFYKHKRFKDGFRSECKNCVKKYKDYNKDKIKEWYLEYYKKNRDKILEYHKSYNLENKTKIKIYRENNKEKIKQSAKKYKKINKDKILKRRREYESIKKQTNPIYKFRHNVRTLIGGCFKRGKNNYEKKTRTEDILSCTIDEFKIYIETKFKKGMSFENHGEWHLDHIIPLASANTEEEIIRLNHYTNFQPLWAEENLSKGDKIDNVQLNLI